MCPFQKNAVVERPHGSRCGKASRSRQQIANGRRPTGELVNASMPDFSRIAPDVKLGRNVRIYAFVNLYGCTIGDETSIGTFVEIQKGVKVGARCKIQSHTFICEGVTIEDEVFVGHNVSFINDLYPRATADGGRMQTERDWRVIPTL